MHAFTNATHAIYQNLYVLEAMQISKLYIFILKWPQSNIKTAKHIWHTELYPSFNLVKQFPLPFSIANPPSSHIDGYFFPMPWNCCTILFVFWTVENSAEQQWRSVLESAEAVPASYCSLYIERTQTHRCLRKILQLQPAT